MGGIGLGIGSLTGNPMLGFSIGMTVGGLLFPENLGTVDQGRASDIRIQGASAGAAVSKVFGIHKVAGSIIMASSVRETFTEENGGGGTGGPQYTTKSYHYDTDLTIVYAEGPISSFRQLVANQDVLYDSTGGGEIWSDKVDPNDIRMRLGTEAEMPDSLWEGIHGVGNVPPYRGFATVTYERLNLDPWGGSIPNLTAEIDGGACNAKVIFDYVCDNCGVLSSKRDFTAVVGKTCRGFVIPARTAGRNIIDNIATMLMFDVVETDGKIRAVVRGGDPVVTIPMSDMGASGGKSPGKDYLSITRQQEVELPKVLTLNYASEELDFSQFSQEARRQTNFSEEESTITTNLVLGNTQARQIAESLLYLQWASRTRYQCSVSYKYLWLAPANIVLLETPFGYRRAKIVEMSYSLMGPISLQLIEDDATIYSQPAVVGVSPTMDENVVTGGQLMWTVRDLNALTDDDADTVGFYSAMASTSTRWQGGDIFVEPKIRNRTGGNTERIAEFSNHCVIGEAVNQLGVGDSTVWDDVNTLDVQLHRGALVSAATDLDVLNGQNLLVVGSEIIQFRYSQPLGSGLFRLSRLLRGRRGSEWAIDDHAAGDPVVLANANGKRFNAHKSMPGKSFEAHALERGRYYASEPPTTTVPIFGRSRMPYAPVHLKGERDGSNNLTLSWVRRSRKDNELQDYYDSPLDEEVEKYKVDLINGIGVVVRSVELVGDPEWVYEATDQTADGITPGDPVIFRVSQFSTAVGYGFTNSREV